MAMHCRSMVDRALEDDRQVSRELAPFRNPREENVSRRFAGKRFCVWLRWAVVLGVTLVALLVPNFADFLSLVGEVMERRFAGKRFCAICPGL